MREDQEEVEGRDSKAAEQCEVLLFSSSFWLLAVKKRKRKKKGSWSQRVQE